MLFGCLVVGVVACYYFVVLCTSGYVGLVACVLYFGYYACCGELLIWCV